VIQLQSTSTSQEQHSISDVLFQSSGANIVTLQFPGKDRYLQSFTIF